MILHHYIVLLRLGTLMLWPFFLCQHISKESTDGFSTRENMENSPFEFDIAACFEHTPKVPNR